MEKLYVNIFQMSVSATYLILAVLFVRFLLQKAPKGMRSFLWLLVGIRLVLPFSVESVFSLIPGTQTVDQYIYDTIADRPLPENIAMTETTMTEAVGTEDQTIPSSQRAHSFTAKDSVDRMGAAIQIGSKIWLMGVILMFSYMLISWVRLKKRVSTSVPIDVSLDCGTAEICQKIYQGVSIESPFLFGLVRPRIYIPDCVSGEELPYVVWHEMTHLGRRDYLIKPVGFLLLSVHWFNPFVWIAYVMLCRDIELICDEKVIRQLGMSCKKAYSQALLNCAVNRRAITACPVAFGEADVKKRVKNVLNYKKPAFWIVVAAVMACIIVPICFMTQRGTDSANTVEPSENTVVQDSVSSGIISTEAYDIDDLLAVTGFYEMINPDLEQYLFTPCINFDKDSTFTFSYSVLSSYLPYGTYEQKDNILTAKTDDGRYHYQFTCVGAVNNCVLFFDTEHSSDVTNIDTKMNLDVPIQNGSIFVKDLLHYTVMEVNGLSQTILQEAAQGTTMTTEELYAMQVSLAELQNQLIKGEMQLQWQLEKTKELQLTQQESAALEARLLEMIQEAQAAERQLEENLVVCQSMLDTSGQSHTAYETIEQWAQAFCDRDGTAIVKLADEKAEQALADRELLQQGFDGKKDYIAFGWSSPWPWGGNAGGNAPHNNYRILNVSDRYAEILYYAWVSDPHVTVWREQLTFRIENDTCVITSEELQFMDSIQTAGEFWQAYPDGITGTMMDYLSFNGAGVALNEHAVSSGDDGWYRKLLEPDSAAVALLNISDDQNKVGVRVENTDSDGDIRTVIFDFYEDGSTVSVQMLQPYGSDGIWVPQMQAGQTTSSVSPNIITSQNIDITITEDAKQLDALFPDHHEPALGDSDIWYEDLNGDGVEERIVFTDLGYVGGDGGYSLTVTDTRTGEKLALPDGYTEEGGVPIRTFYSVQPGEEPQLLIQLGEEKRCQIIAEIMRQPLYGFYERQGLYAEFKNALPDHSGQVATADALSGCNIVRYKGEENPIIVLKTYVSGFLGHADTLGYVITELRLLEDNTWSSKHYFLLDGCYGTAMLQQESAAAAGNGNTFLPYNDKMDMDFIQLTPEE